MNSGRTILHSLTPKLMDSCCAKHGKQNTTQEYGFVLQLFRVTLGTQETHSSLLLHLQGSG